MKYFTNDVVDYYRDINNHIKEYIKLHYCKEIIKIYIQ